MNKKVICPFCNKEIGGMAGIMISNSMNSIDFQSTCPNCHKTLTKKDFVNQTKDTSLNDKDIDLS